VNAHRRSLASLPNWRGTVHMFSRAPTDPHTCDVSFVYDRAQNAVRWERRFLSPPQKDGTSAPDRIENGMVKDGVYYKFGPFAVNDPEQKRTLVISVPDYGDHRFYAAFDPRWYLRFDEDLLLYYHETWNRLPSPSAWKEGSVVIFEMRDGETTNRYEYDLSQGGNQIRSCYLAPSEILEDSRCYKQVDGIWVSDRYRYKHLELAEDPADDVCFEETADFSKHVMNQPSDATEFSVNRLGVRQGDRIFDKRTQTEYEARPAAGPTDETIEIRPGPPSPSKPDTKPVGKGSGER